MKLFAFRSRSKLILVTILVSTLLMILGNNISQAASQGQTVVQITILPNTDPLTSLPLLAWPEKRVGFNNLSTKLRTRIYNTSDSTMYLEDIANSANNGLQSSIDVSALSPGNYNLLIKGESHLTRKLTNYALYSLLDRIDTTRNSTRFLLAGDVNGVEFGDDVVNSIDLSILITDLDAFDLRSDLNRDNIVNALDLSALLTNLDQVGES